MELSNGSCMGFGASEGGGILQALSKSLSMKLMLTACTLRFKTGRRRLDS